MGEGRDGLIEVRGAQAPEAEITQESPQGGDQVSSRGSPAVAGSVERELSYLHCLPTAGIGTQGVDQSGRATGILAQCGFCRPTLLSEPIAKRDNQFAFRPCLVYSSSVTEGRLREQTVRSRPGYPRLLILNALALQLLRQIGIMAILIPSLFR